MVSTSHTHLITAHDAQFLSYLVRSRELETAHARMQARSQPGSLPQLLLHNKTCPRALHMSSRTSSAHRITTYEPYAAGFGQDHPCCALAVPSRHRSHRRRTWMMLHIVCAALSTSSHMAFTSPMALSRPHRRRWSSCGSILRHEHALSDQCNLIHRSAGHVRRAHRMAAKSSAARRPSTLLWHTYAVRCQRWQLMQWTQRAAAAAACESSGAGATWWTAAAIGRTAA